MDATYNGKDGSIPPVVGIALGTTIGLVFNKPQAMEELFVSKNKYFDRHPRSKNFLLKILGDSILFE